MINSLLKMMHRPEKGWDPISAAYAKECSTAVYRPDFTDKLIKSMKL